MDTIYMIVIIVVHLNCLVYGDEKDPTDCKSGPKYETCECTDKPFNPRNGFIEVANNTFGMYKCNRGYSLNVYAIIRCHYGGRGKLNFWNTTNDACIAIDDCHPNPCLKVDVCIDGIENYTCICLPGFTGKTCSDNMTETMTTSESSTYPTNHDSTINQTISRNIETTTEGDIVPTTSEKIITTRKEAKLSSLAISIAIPVVVVVLIAVTLVIFLLRCKRKISKQPVKLRDKLTGPTITNKSYDVESQKKSYVQTLQSQESQYHHIQMNNVDTKEGSVNVYQTIDASPDDRGIRNSNYYHLDSVANLIVKHTYSHISVISSYGSHLDDLTYSHTHNLYLSQGINENTQDADNDESYNRLGSTVRRSYIHNKPNEIIDDETDFNHTLLKPSRRTDETETYSHLTTS